MSLPWASLFQSAHTCILKVIFNIIISSALSSTRWFVSTCFSNRILCVCYLSLSFLPCHPTSRYAHSKRVYFATRSLMLSTIQCLPSTVTPPLLGSNILQSAILWDILACVFPKLSPFFSDISLFAVSHNNNRPSERSGGRIENRWTGEQRRAAEMKVNGYNTAALLSERNWIAFVCLLRMKRNDVLGFEKFYRSLWLLCLCKKCWE